MEPLQPYAHHTRHKPPSTTKLTPHSLEGILYLTSPLTFTLLTLHPSLRRWCGPLGLLITSGSFLASAFASHVWQLIALQGVSAALGGGLLYAPATLCLDERFARRKGLAYGIMGAAKSGVGVGLPFAASAALQRFGYRATIVGWAVAVVGCLNFFASSPCVCLSCLLPFRFLGYAASVGGFHAHVVRSLGSGEAGSKRRTPRLAPGYGGRVDVRDVCLPFFLWFTVACENWLSSTGLTFARNAY